MISLIKGFADALILICLLAIVGTAWSPFALNCKLHRYRPSIWDSCGPVHYRTYRYSHRTGTCVIPYALPYHTRTVWRCNFRRQVSRYHRGYEGRIASIESTDIRTCPIYDSRMRKRIQRIIETYKCLFLLNVEKILNVFCAKPRNTLKTLEMRHETGRQIVSACQVCISNPEMLFGRVTKKTILKEYIV